MKVRFLICCLLCSTLSFAQEEDPIVMRINGQPVPRSEFEYNYNKNNNDNVVDKKSVSEYVDLFVNYKLKVIAAEEAQLDTLSSFKQEFLTYRNQQIRSLLLPQNLMEVECKKYYDGMKAALQGKKLIKPAHIFIRLKQMADEGEKQKAQTRIDSVYQALKDGADFATMAQQVSEDPGSASKGGELPWIGPNQTLKEFEDVAYSLQVGEYSEPFISTVGYHIVKMVDQKELEDYETLKPNIQRFMERQGLEEKMSTKILENMSKTSNKTIEEILDDETERLSKEDSDLKYLIKEYHDGLLLFEICSRQIWEPASRDTVGIERYFKANKKKYIWEKPHYKGMIFHCREKADIKNVQKALKKVDESGWISTIREKFNKDSVTVKMEKRLFEEGENTNVDVLAFKKKGALEPMQDFPYTGIIGKSLKKNPEDWSDVGGQVISDYQHAQEMEFAKKLRERYTIEVDEDILKTVNNH